MKLVYTVLVLAALVYAERRLIEPRLTGARLSALVQAALVYKVLVYQEWIRVHEMFPGLNLLGHLYDFTLPLSPSDLGGPISSMLELAEC